MGTGVVIRAATEADIPRCVDLVEALVASVGGPQRVCRIKTGETFAGLIHAPSGAVFVSVGGFIAGQIGATVVSPDPVAWELGWFARDRSGMALLATFEAWAKERGACMIKMSCAGGAVQRLLDRRGYAVAEVQMFKAVV